MVSSLLVILQKMNLLVINVFIVLLFALSRVLINGKYHRLSNAVLFISFSGLRKPF